MPSETRSVSEPTSSSGVTSDVWGTVVSPKGDAALRARTTDVKPRGDSLASVSTGPMRGVVAAGDPQTAAAGGALLRQGGNAIDAAAAAAFAAFVCEMPLCSALGGGVALVHRAGEEPRAIDMFARTPGLGAGERRAMEFEGVEVSFGAATQVFHVGRASAAVPLALEGIVEMHRRWGQRPIADVVAPAIELARSGYVVGPGVAFVFQVLEPIVRRSEACAALHSHDGSPSGALAKVGARLSNRDLGSTLESIGARPKATVRELMAQFGEAFGVAHGGLVTDRDIDEATVTESAAVRVSHAKWDLATMPGPSTGGVLVALGARLLDGIGVTEFLSRDHVLRMASVQEALLGERSRCGRFDERCRDPREVSTILDETRIAGLAAGLGGSTKAPGSENPLGSTTHISVIDENGTAVSLTLTNGEGCGHLLDGTGMIVNNLLGEEDLHPRGFHTDAPGTPLTTMMAPTLLSRGADRIALGSGGSNRLRTAILHVISALVDHGIDPERAVVAPRLHVERSATDDGPRVAFERCGLDPTAADALAARFPRAPAIFDAPNLYFGGVNMALRVAGGFRGVGDPRRGGGVSVG